MPNWYSPFTPGEGAKRFFSLLNLALAALVLLACASEFRFDWAERLVGQYLMTLNTSRPETGGIWEAGRQTLNAHQSLNRIITKKQSTLRSVREAESFAALAGRLVPGEWANLDRSQFKALFSSLPAGIRDSLVEPARLVWLMTTEVVDRIFCEGQMGGMAVYFIDTDNRVVYQFRLEKKDLSSDTLPRGTHTRLDDMPGVFSRILPAEQFFNALFRLPGEMVSELVGNPDLLLRQEGSLRRVGIGDIAENGYIRLGFEFVGLDGTWVVQIQAREWAVWQLNLTLKGEGP